MLSTSTASKPGSAAAPFSVSSPLDPALLNWRSILWPADQSLAESSLRITALGNMALCLPLVLSMLRMSPVVAVFALYLLLNVGGIFLVAYRQSLSARLVLMGGAPLMFYLLAVFLHLNTDVAVLSPARIALMAMAVTPTLLLDPKQVRLMTGLLIWNTVLLATLSLWSFGETAITTGFDAITLITSLLAISFLGLLFATYRKRSHAKDQQIRYLLEALTDSTLNLNTVNQALNESSAQLSRSNQDKDRLFSIIAHDLRMPMATFQSFSNLLAEHAEHLTPEDVREMTQGMRKSFDQLTSLLDNLLSWSQNQLQTLKPRSVEFALCGLLEHVQGIYADVALRKGVRIVLRCEGGLFPKTDPDLLSTVLRNLLSNAIKYSKADGVIEVSAELTGAQVLLRVRDFGVGMDLETQKQLFTIGVRKSLTGTSGEKGTGLGTVLVRDFLRLMGSELFIESRVGMGTTAWFYLPLAKN